MSKNFKAPKQILASLRIVEWFFEFVKKKNINRLELKNIFNDDRNACGSFHLSEKPREFQEKLDFTRVFDIALKEYVHITWEINK